MALASMLTGMFIILYLTFHAERRIFSIFTCIQFSVRGFSWLTSMQHDVAPAFIRFDDVIHADNVLTTNKVISTTLTDLTLYLRIGLALLRKCTALYITFTIWHRRLVV